jgi:hypothetical protein
MEIFTRDDFNKWAERNHDYEFAHEMACLLVYKSVEEMLRILPGVIRNLVKSTIMLRDLTDRFYEQNKDLVAHKDVVARVIEGLELKAPGIDLEQLLKEAAPLARKQIRMRK